MGFLWCSPHTNCVCFCSDEEQNEPKTKLELMAEMRDYKRRRQSYRAKNVHITKKSYTEVDELIKNNKCCPDSNHLLHLYIIHDEGEITFSLNYEGCCESQEPLFPSLVGNVKSNSTLKW